jgi:molybdate transport system substrate-binding protein
MTDIAAAYERESGGRTELSFGSSGQIMAQVDGGAAIDVFVSAAQKQVEDLAKQGLVDPDSQRIIAGNALVLIVPRDSALKLDSFESLATADVKRLAIGEPKTVPAGQYASQALERLKLAGALADKLVYGSNVRQVLDYVTRGEVSAGIVYSTDAKQAKHKVNVVATAPAESHDAIVYPAVVVKKSGHAGAAKKFLEYLASDDAQRVLKDHGFTMPATPAAAAPANAAPGNAPDRGP